MDDNDQIVKDILTKPTELSDDQRLAVLTTSRFCRTIAGAGAGKTETLYIVYIGYIHYIRRDTRKPADADGACTSYGEQHRA